jgi:hypothetical protein
MAAHLAERHRPFLNRIHLHGDLHMAITTLATGEESHDIAPEPRTTLALGEEDAAAGAPGTTSTGEDAGTDGADVLDPFGAF